MIQTETNAPCGMYCGVCRIYMATQANELKYLERLAQIYARQFPDLDLNDPEALLCDGCQSSRRAVFCRVCAIRDCTQNKRVEGCHQCDDFPCELIDQFPMPVGKKVILRAVPLRHSMGNQVWIQTENERYHCPNCGAKLFRGARQCPDCKSPVNVD